jgi:hypothetical protein
VLSGFLWPRAGKVAGPFQHVNEPSISKRGARRGRTSWLAEWVLAYEEGQWITELVLIFKVGYLIQVTFGAGSEETQKLPQSWWPRFELRTSRIQTRKANHWSRKPGHSLVIPDNRQLDTGVFTWQLSQALEGLLKLSSCCELGST